MRLFHASTCFEHCVLIIRKSKLYYYVYSLWYHHTEKSEWSVITKRTKINKIHFYKYEHTVVKFMWEFFGCDYCLLFSLFGVPSRCACIINKIGFLFSLAQPFYYKLVKVTFCYSFTLTTCFDSTKESSSGCCLT